MILSPSHSAISQSLLERNCWFGVADLKFWNFPAICYREFICPTFLQLGVEVERPFPKTTLHFLTLFLLDVNLKTNKLRKYVAILWGNDLSMLPCLVSVCSCWQKFCASWRSHFKLQLVQYWTRIEPPSTPSQLYLISICHVCFKHLKISPLIFRCQGCGCQVQERSGKTCLGLVV